MLAINLEVSPGTDIWAMLAQNGKVKKRMLLESQTETCVTHHYPRRRRRQRRQLCTRVLHLSVLMEIDHRF